jgi:hypothetical protein
MTHKLIKTTDYILVVDDSLTIGKGYAVNRDYKIMKYNTDEHLAYDSYAVKKIIAHLPLNGSPILEGVDLLPPYSRHQEDGVEQLVNTMFRNKIDSLEEIHSDYILGVTEGYNKAREKYKYTEEDMLEFANWCRIHDKKHPNEVWMIGQLLTKYESIHQYPTEFECEMEDYCGSPLTTERCPKCIDSCDRAYQRPKTITTAQGVEWVGKYN